MPASSAADDALGRAVLRRPKSRSPCANRSALREVQPPHRASPGRHVEPSSGTAPTPPPAGSRAQLARTYAERVAFVGLDSKDDRGDAQSFLDRFPVSYPSVFDASAAQARSIGGGLGWPTTFFYDHTGRQTLIHQGAYTSRAALQADVERYALAATS